jgi:hypothetical protein
MTKKLIVTNRKALHAKYGNSGFKKIEARLKKLIAADRKRGVDTVLVSMDIKRDVTPHSAPQIRVHGDPAQAKDCIDALFNAIRPDYLLILGAPDVVCQQPLDNPVIGDEDLDVPSDLPYACDAGFSTEISDFVGPTRVVGRLPDIAGESDPTALLEAIDTAVGWQRRNRNAYNTCCAISTESWKTSTRKSVKSIFGSARVRHISPPSGPPWSKRELRPRMHFVNCHGLDFDTAFYGDDGAGQEPLAIDQADYDTRLRDGTVFAAECCYGAMLYEAPLFGIPPGICNTVLWNGAYGFMGSTNVAYGPADSNGYADLVCRYFMSNVLNGASTGRALLEARQKYSRGEAPLDPVDLKTLAQFNLLSDPSVHPVRMAARAKRATAAGKSLATTSARRHKLKRNGVRIGQSVAYVHSRADMSIDEELRQDVLRGIPKEHFKDLGEVFSFAVHAARRPRLATSKAARIRAEGGGCYHVVGATDVRRQRPEPRVQMKERSASPGPDVLVIAMEQDNKITYTKTVYRR